MQFFESDYASSYSDPNNFPTTNNINNPADTQAFLGAANPLYGSFEGEPPLLEELGINFSHIYTKTKCVLNPFSKIDSHIMDDTDIAGPLCFGVLLGFILLMSGKVHFGYIYGMGVVGCISIYCVLNLMSETAVDITRVVSVMGYCLLPMVILGFLSLWISLNGIFGWSISAIFILWCTHSAALMFVRVLQLVDQRLLVAYPVGLVYTCFALLTIF